jgi:hypothetical protein
VYINQLDDHEKAQQLSLMSQICASPDLLYVKLGPNADDSDLAMHNIGSLNLRICDTRELKQVQRQTLLKFGIPTFDDPVWTAISRLFDREWFTRVRVIRELLLARLSLSSTAAK